MVLRGKMLTLEIKIEIHAGTGIVKSISGPQEFMVNETVILGIFESAKSRVIEQIRKQEAMIVGGVKPEVKSS